LDQDKDQWYDFVNKEINQRIPKISGVSWQTTGLLALQEDLYGVR
jgi:hypothetical protein